MALGTRIKTLREQRGFTQIQLAKMVGTSQSTIQSIEQRDSRMTRLDGKIAAALGVSLDYLRHGDTGVNEPAATYTTQDVALFADVLHSLDGDQRALLLDIVRVFQVSATTNNKLPRNSERRRRSKHDRQDQEITPPRKAAD